MDTLVAAIRDLPPLSRDYSDEYQHLAEFERYSHLHVSLTDPRYTAALLKLEEIDRHREQTDFVLTDLRGHQWSLKKLQGNVVLVNFWATWCPPCVRELRDLDAAYRRFESKNIVHIAITDEDASTDEEAVLAEHPLSYPILLDTSAFTAWGVVKKDFAVTGIPKSFVFGRDGRLVAESIDRPTEKQLLDMLGDSRCLEW